jgi:MoxR-like ATPase
MPSVSAGLLKHALEHLQRYPPLLLISLPAMTRNDVPTGDGPEDAVRFGSVQENGVLDAYFRPPGGPAGRPYFNTRDWVRSDYAGSSLQRQRVDHSRDLFFKGAGSTFCLRKDIADTIAADNNLLPGGERISLVALGAWLYRQEEVASIDDLAQKTIADFKLDRDELLDKVFTSVTTAEETAEGLAAEALTDADIAVFTGAAPPAPEFPGSLADFVASLEQKLKDRHVILAPDVVSRIVTAWAARDIVVLVGAPGTGKTTLATELAEALVEFMAPGTEPVVIPVEPDYDVTRVLGYENLAGEFVPRQLTTHILRTENPLHPHVVLLEEWNTAQVETYLAPLLQAIEGGNAIPLSGQESVTLPIDTLFLATCNSYRDEPETRLPISRPTKRRTTIIQMPNVLQEAFERDGENGIRKSAADLLARERTEVEGRSAAGRATWFDALRDPRLQAVQDVDAFGDPARTVLLQLVAYLLGETAEGPRFFTAGLFKDILVHLALTDDPAAALTYQITDKVLHQVTTLPVAQEIAERTKDLPEHGVIEATIAELEGPGGSLAPLI